MPVWLSWFEYISWFKYANEALVINQWRGMELPCTGDNGIPLPDNVTLPCPWDEAPLDQVCDPSGNLTVALPPDATLPVCIFSNDQDIFDFYGYKEVNPVAVYQYSSFVEDNFLCSQGNFAFDIIMLVVLAVVLRAIGFLALLLKTRRKSS